MRFRSICWLHCIVVLALSVDCSAQFAESEIRQLGLETAWRSYVQVPRSGTTVVSSHLWVEETEPRTFAVVELEDREIRVPTEALDRFGKPLGVEGATEKAREQAARYLGKSDGIQVVQRNVPRIKLILVTSDGMVQALDAETGMHIWSTACGTSHAPAYPAAVGPAGVSVIHGRSLYLIDRETGQHLKTKRLRSSTSNAVAVCGDMAFVSDFTGTVNTYGLAADRIPWTHRIRGRAIGAPVSLSDQKFCGIACEGGLLYVFAYDENPSTWLRWETSSPIAGALAAGNNAFYVGSTGGVLAKVSVATRLGSIEWEQYTGLVITTPPLVIGDTVYAATEEGSVFAFDDTNSGATKWRNDGNHIIRVLAKAGDRMVCSTKTDRVVVLDAATGKTLGRTGMVPLGNSVLNSVNDRAYVLAADGRLQCLRAASATLPTMVTPVVLTEEQEQTGQEEIESSDASQGASSGNIFDSGASGSSPAGGMFEKDPFSGGLGGNASEDTTENPFGAFGEPAAGGDGDAPNPFGDF